MVAVVTGAGLGLQRDSASVLGSQGQVGTTALGQGGDQVTVNATNGNLVIQSTDEILIGTGPDDIVTNTYNSQSTLTANAWQESFQRHTGSLGGTVNTSGSTIKHYGADGTTTTYTYDTTKGLYVGNEAGGAYDTLSYNTSTSKWTWQDGKTRVAEVYDGANSGRLVSTTDADGNTLTYSYTGTQLTKITTANGEYTSFTYTGSLLTSVSMYDASNNLIHIRTRYGYDASNRLQSVTVDLTPSDGQISDGNTYVTTYTYDGTSNRVASITQSDGSNLQIAYSLVGSAYAVSSFSRTPFPGAATETTTFTYGTGRTTVTDSQGNATTLLYDSNSRLIQMTSPAAAPGGPVQNQAFTYDANGNLLFSGPAGDPNFTNIGTYWNDLTISDGTVTTTQSTEVDGSVAVYRRQTTTTPTSGVTMRLGTTGGRIAVSPGQTMQFSVYAASSGASSLKLYAMWRDVNGTSITNSTVATITTGGTLGASGLVTAKFASGSSTAPAGAAFVELMVQGTADGTGPMNVAIAQPLAIVTGSTLPPSFTYTYDTNGSCLSKMDSLGNKTIYVYDGNNQLLTKTVYADGATAQTTRYVYDAESHLTYVLSPLGEVTQYVYNAAGQQRSAIQYTSQADIYTVTGLATNASPSLATMNTWAAAVADLKTIQRTDTTYDGRGAIATITTYGKTNSDGTGVIWTGVTTGYTTSPEGLVLSRILADGTETYLYDGLWRTTSYKDAANRTTSTTWTKWLDADGITQDGAKATVTLANGTTEVSYYDLAGELNHVATTGTNLSTTSNNLYDSDGNLIRTVDPLGNASYFVYDDQNRKVADVAPDGAVTAYIYNTADQLISTVTYANRLSSIQLNSLGSEAAFTTTPLGLSDVTPTTSTADSRSWNVYDADGRLAEKIDPLGYVTAYTYDGTSNPVSGTAYANALSSTTLSGFVAAPPTSLVLPTADATFDRTTRSIYDADGRVAYTIDAMGIVTGYLYDDAGNLIQTNLYATAFTATGVQSLAQMGTWLTTNSGIVSLSRTVHDAAGRVAYVIDPTGAVTNYHYDGDGRVDMTTQYANFFTTTGRQAWDGMDTWAGTNATASDLMTRTVYDAEGRVLYAIDGTGTVTANGYDTLGTVNQTVSYAAAFTTAGVQTATTMASWVSANASATNDLLSRTLNDAVGRVIYSIDPTGAVTSYVRDGDGNVIQTVRYMVAYTTAGTLTPTGMTSWIGTSSNTTGSLVTRSVYDVDSQLAYSIDAAGTVTAYGYDTSGNVIQTTEYTGAAYATTGNPSMSDMASWVSTNGAASHVTRQVYDADGRLAYTLDAAGMVTAYTGDLAGEVTKTIQYYVLNATTGPQTADQMKTWVAANVNAVNDRSSTVTYDRDGRVVSTVDPSGFLSYNVYDAVGRLAFAVDGTGSVTGYTNYDADSRPVLTTAYAASNTATSVQSLTQMQTWVTANASASADIVSRSAYDIFGRLAFVIDGTGAVTRYEYDGDGNVLQTTRFGTLFTTTGVQTFSQMTSWAASHTTGNLVTRAIYDTFGRLAYTIDATGLVISNTYDGDDRVTQTTRYTNLYLTTGIQSYATLHTWSTTAGNLDSANDETTTYAYNVVGELVSTTDPMGYLTYTAYDAAGRKGYLVDATGAVTVFGYDAASRLIQTIQYAKLYTTAGVQAFATLQTWYANSSHLDAANDRTTRIVYDGAGHQGFAIDPTGAVTAYTYDPFGETVQTVQYSTLYTTSGTQSLTTMQSWTSSHSSGSLTTRAAYKADGQLAYGIDANGAVTGYSYDGDGNVIQTVQYSKLYTTSGVQTYDTLHAWYTTAGNLDAANDLVNRTIYDSFGRAAYSIDGDGAVTANTYDKDGRVTMAVRYYALDTATGVQTMAQMQTWVGSNASAANDLVTRAAYDTFGRVVYSIDATGAVVGYTTYDADGRATVTVQYMFLFTTAGVQTLSQMTSWAGSHSTGSLTTRSTYDTFGRLAFAIDATGTVTAYSFDRDDRTTKTVEYFVTNVTTGAQSLSTMKTWVTSNNNAANDLATTYTYNGLGELVSTTDPLGFLTYTAYDTAGRKGYTVDATGAVTAYVYDTDSRLVQTVQYINLYTVANVQTFDTLKTWFTSSSHLDAVNDRTMRYAFDAMGRQTFVIDAMGAATGYTYDGDGNVIQAMQYAKAYTTAGIQSSATLQTWYTTASNLDAANDRTTRYAYDAAGRQTFVIDAMGAVTSTAYDADDNVTQTVQYAPAFTTSGVQTQDQMKYWASNNGSGSTATTTVYDAFDRAVYGVDAAGYVTFYSYDGDDRVTQTIQYAKPYTASGALTLGGVQSWFTNSSNLDATHDRANRSVYDAAGRQVYAIDANGVVTALAPDGDGNVVQTIQYATIFTATGPQTQTQMQTWVTNNPNQDLTTRAAYDTFGRLAYSIDAMGAVVGYVYDLDSRITTKNEYSLLYTTSGVQTAGILQGWYTNASHLDASNDRTTTYTYDKDGRVKTTQAPGGGVTSKAYNAFGDVVTVTDPKGNSGYFYYDAMGRQTWQLDAGSYVTKTAYDFTGQVLSVTRYSGVATFVNLTTTPTLSHTDTGYNLTSLMRDHDSRLVTSTDGNGYVTAYTYDSFGNVIKTVDGNNNSALTYYDQLGRKTTTVDALGFMTTYLYDAEGNITTQTQYANALSSTVLNALVAGGTPPTPPTSNVSDRIITNTYDNADRLLTQTGTSVTVTATDGSTTSVAPKQTSAYDRRGNQISAKDSNSAFTYTYYDLQNRKIAQVNALGFLTTWSYDAYGNVKTQKAYSTAPALAADPTTVVPTGTGDYRETDYTYDKDGRQITTSVMGGNGGTTSGVESGAWNGNAWVSTTAALKTKSFYDADGNVVEQIDANNNTSFMVYDNLGRKVQDIDAAGFITSYTFDAEGNVTQQTQYATALSSTVFQALVAGCGVQSPPATTADDRTTTFTYDHDGQRKTETRSVILYTSTGQSTASEQILFDYNGLGQLTRKTEATGDKTDYVYDKLGHVSQVITAVGQSNSMTTTTTYDGLGNVLTTVAAATVNPTTTETTTYTYGAGGRLATKTDATGFVVTYGYDANGQNTIQSYTRKKSDNTTVQEAVQTAYDAMGQTVSTAQATLSGGLWSSTDTTSLFYNAFGELIARGTNTGGNIQKAQEYSDYDAAGRVWRTNMDDGVTKVYGYDANGNKTLEIKSLDATTNLMSVGSLDAAFAASGVTKTMSVYDTRDELISVERPTSVNLDGTVASGRAVSIGPTYTVAGTFTNTPATTYGGTCTTAITVTLSSSALTTRNGTGAIHVVVSDTYNGSTQSLSFASGSTNCGTYSFDFQAPDDPRFRDPDAPPPVDQFTVQVYQDGPNNSQIQLATLFRGDLGRKGGGVITNMTVAGVGSSLKFQGVDPSATALTLYVRPTGSTGGYTAVPATQMLDTSNNPIQGSFTFDTTQQPFNGTANSSWDVKYQASDTTGKVVDAKGGTLTFDGGSPPVPTAANFTSIATFTATQSGGTWQITNNAVVAGNAETRQAFNAFGDVTSQTDANGNTTTFVYDRRGDLYQKVGAAVTVVDATGHASPTKVSPTDSYYYDISGRLIGHTDANQNTTTQDLLAGTGYGGADALVTAQHNPSGGGTVYTSYDVFGNAITQTDALTFVTTNTYDGDNRLISVSHETRVAADSAYTSGGINTLIDTYAYDGLGQRIKHTNNVLTSAAETTDYDAQGRVIKSSTFGGQITNYSYAWTAMSATGRATAGQEDTNNQGTAGYWTKTTSAFGQTSTSTTDDFGTLIASQDFGGHAATYSYNFGGQVTKQRGTGTNTQSIDYSYTTSGQIASVTDNATGTKSFYAYDKNGNRTVEGYDRPGATTAYYQNEIITYDELNRVTEIKDAKADITYSYDADGNRREVRSVYYNLGFDAYGNYKTTTQDYWYTYDNMNRFLITEGSLVINAIVTGSTGVSITYNSRGDRASATYGSDGHVETYQYSADGYLETVKIAVKDANGVLGASMLSAKRVTNVFGQMTSYTEYQSDGSTVLSTRAMTYDNDNRITSETDQTYATNNGTAVTYTSQITNDYRLWSGTSYNGTDIGMLVHSQNAQTQTGTTGTVTTTTVNTYGWWGQAKQTAATITGSDPNNPNSNQWAPGNTNYHYDANGNLTQVVDGATNGVNRTVNYQDDVYGQVLLRQEIDYGSVLAQRTFFYLNGRAVGDVGNDSLESRVDYAQQLATDRTDAANAGQAMYFSPSTPTVGVNADFDNSYQAYNATSVGQAGSSYTAGDGDTLQSIALNLWGDSSLWYVLADANGLGAGTSLVAGQTLTIPANVAVMHNNSTVFKPYDPNDALGNTNPTLPQEPQPPAPKHGCGMIGDLIANIISAAVEALVTLATFALPPPLANALAAAAGDATRQVIEIAVGNQKKFSWSEVASAAVAAAIETKFHLNSTKDVEKFQKNMQPWVKAGQMMASSAIEQGTNIAFRVQRKFSWTDLAAAGVKGGVGQWVTNWEDNGGLPENSQIDPITNKPLGASTTLRGIAVTNTAEIMAGAVTRTAITGQDIGKSIREALPAVVGATIGNWIGQGIAEHYHIGQKSEDDPRPSQQPKNATQAPSDYVAAYMAKHGINLDFKFGAKADNGLPSWLQNPTYIDSIDATSTDQLVDTSYKVATKNGVLPKNAYVYHLDWSTKAIGTLQYDYDLRVSILSGNDHGIASTDVFDKQGVRQRTFFDASTGENIGTVPVVAGESDLLKDGLTAVRFDALPEDRNEWPVQSGGEVLADFMTRQGYSLEKDMHDKKSIDFSSSKKLYSALQGMATEVTSDNNITSVYFSNNTIDHINRASFDLFEGASIAHLVQPTEIPTGAMSYAGYIHMNAGGGHTSAGFGGVEGMGSRGATLDKSFSGERAIGILSGRRTTIPPLSDAATIRSLTRENQSADILVQNGYNVVQNPGVAGIKNPDYLVNGDIYDNYAPETNNVRNIASSMSRKADSGQSNNIVLNLSDSKVTPMEIQLQLSKYPPSSNLRNVIIISKSESVYFFKVN